MVEETKLKPHEKIKGDSLNDFQGESHMEEALH